MTPRVCIIGDSHTAALKEGWQAAGDAFRSVEPVFFGAPIYRMIDLQRRGATLVPGTMALSKRFVMASGGSSEIADIYDAYIVYGLALSPYRLFQLCRRHRASGYPEDGRVLLSRRCHHEAVCALLETTLACAILRMLTEVTRAPILLLASPMPSEEDADRLAPIIESGNDAPLADTYLAGCRAVAFRHGACFMAQPQDTLGASRLTTRRAFSLAATREGARKQGDLVHMNGEYGALLARHVLPQLLSRIEAGLPGGFRRAEDARISSGSPHTPRSSGG